MFSPKNVLHLAAVTAILLSVSSSVLAWAAGGLPGSTPAQAEWLYVSTRRHNRRVHSRTAVRITHLCLTASCYVNAA